MIAVIMGNPAMIDAYKRQAFPGRRQDGENSLESKKQPTAPGTQHDVDFMVKDSKRFVDSGGWGRGAFDYDAPSDSFSPSTLASKPPQGNDAGSRAIRWFRTAITFLRNTESGDRQLRRPVG